MEKTIGVIGLGKMGKNIVFNLLDKKYTVFAYNRSPEPRKEVEKAGAISVASIQELVKKLKTNHRVIWSMLPAGDVTDTNIKLLSRLLKRGDFVIDGSNSYYKNSINNYNVLKARGIHYLDSGSSGGPYGARHGMSLMIGGDRDAFKHLEPLFKDLSINEDGYLYIGPAGSGHFVKMVHNGVEYGMMESLGEGMALIKKYLPRGTDLSRIAGVWNNGSVISGRLVGWAENALKNEGNELSNIAPYVVDTGEARWTVLAGIEYDVPLPIISDSLFKRFDSRDEDNYSARMLAALRHEFGGHDVKKAGEKGKQRKE